MTGLAGTSLTAGETIGLWVSKFCFGPLVSRTHAIITFITKASAQNTVRTAPPKAARPISTNRGESRLFPQMAAEKPDCMTRGNAMAVTTMKRMPRAPMLAQTVATALVNMYTPIRSAAETLISFLSLSWRRILPPHPLDWHRKWRAGGAPLRPKYMTLVRGCPTLSRAVRKGGPGEAPYYPLARKLATHRPISFPHCAEYCSGKRRPGENRRAASDWAKRSGVPDSTRGTRKTSLRFLQGCEAMPPASCCANVRGSRPSQKSAKDGTHDFCTADKIKSWATRSAHRKERDECTRRLPIPL